jgi:SAM-dependent methyltransferase
VRNYFVHRDAAQRYAAARPYFHPLVVARIAAFTGHARFAHALDVGCGTGQSARALAEICDVVEAIDPAADMLSEADPHPRVRYQAAAAECLPFADDSFDLVTAGLAFHWFDQPAFLREAARVLKPGGWLAIYTDGFAGEMLENAAFRAWARDVYGSKFPAPPRKAAGVSDELAASGGLTLRGSEQYTHSECMTVEQLTAYLLTQTNVIAAIESGATSLDEAGAWIATGLTPFFQTPHGTFNFRGAVWYLQQ